MEENIQTTEYRRSKVWQLFLFTMNNGATNAALLLMGRYAYFTQNILGLMAVAVGAIATIMRVFDGVTDPLIGFLMDKTDTKFGRFRIYMSVGCIVTCAGVWAIFHAPEGLGTAGYYVYTTVFYVVYVLGYTCQTSVTKAGQTVMTNDPKQRPLYSGFDTLLTRLVAIFNTILITVILANKYAVGDYESGGLLNPEMWKKASSIICILMIVMTILAIIGIWQKDKPEYYLKASAPQVKLKDYVDVIAHNRPVQMLIISAATDKLGTLLTSGLLVYICSNMLLNSSYEGYFTMASIIPVVGAAFIGVTISRKKGLKKNFIIGTTGSMIMLIVLLIIHPSADHPWIWLGILVFQNCLYCLASSSVVPMLADCTDYETYRSGKYIPGMIGTIFSFVDKVISSLSNLFVGIALVAAGVGNTVIAVNETISTRFNVIILLFFCGIPILGHIASLIAMKFYDLDATKMKMIQADLAARDLTSEK